ncbi:MAG: sigma-70 family RNA polymerase sigma factor [Myxococcales bacterium]|nr:sigma-70 family RNA polymerase sigma factor [Myxococcales bacterium]
MLTRFLGNKVDDETANEIVSQTFERLFSGTLARYKAQSSLTTFTVGVAYHCLREHVRAVTRRRGAVDPDEVTLASLFPTPSQVVAQSEREHRLFAALRQIPLEHQTILELHYWGDHTTASIAEILEIPVGTVRSRLDRARELLRVKLKEGHFDESSWTRA